MNCWWVGGGGGIRKVGGELLVGRRGGGGIRKVGGELLVGRGD